MNWFYAKDGQQIGPVEFSEIQRLHAEGQLTEDSLIWEQGSPNWVKLSSVLGGGSATPASPQAYQQGGAPVRAAGAQGLPDYGDLLCWGFIGVLIPCLGIAAFIALIVMHCMEYFGARKEVLAGRLAKSSYSDVNPALFLLGMICCGGLLYPLFMHLRNKSGYFKQQPNAVLVSIIVIIVSIVINGLFTAGKYAAAAAQMSN